MNFRTVSYHPRYRAQCIALMKDTWNFNSLFPGLRVRNLVNEVFFDLAVSSADYSQLIVDEKGKAQGYIFGRTDQGLSARIRRLGMTMGILIRLAGHFLKRDFGPWKEAWSRAGELFAMEHELESKKKPSDAYVSLFFLSSSLRGQGWGKCLMDAFQDRALSRGYLRIYLWTDKGCNYPFYDRQGFCRIHSISSPYLSLYGSGQNGFVYVKELMPA